MAKCNHQFLLHSLNELFKDHFANLQSQVYEIYQMIDEKEMFQQKVYRFKSHQFQLRMQINNRSLQELGQDNSSPYQLEIKEKIKISQISQRCNPKSN